MPDVIRLDTFEVDLQLFRQAAVSSDERSVRFPGIFAGAVAGPVDQVFDGSVRQFPVRDDFVDDVFPVSFTGP